MYKTDVIKHYDEFNIIDVIQEKQLAKPFIGLVRIFENNILNTDQTPDGWLTNMTIATGREFAAQSLFKKSSPSSLFGDISIIR